MLTPSLITPESHPEHTTVGKHFGAYLDEESGTVIYLCDSYDPRLGFWMTQVDDLSNRRNVSERAIGRIFHRAYDEGDHWHVGQWNVKVQKTLAVQV